VSPRWAYFVPGYLWSALNTLIGVLLCVLVYRATDWRWSRGCIECIGGDRIFGKPGAQTWGAIVIYKDEYQRSRVDLRVHERVHVVQAFIGGPLFMIAYGLTFLWFYLNDPKMGWKVAYYQIPFEVQAYRIGDKAKGWGA